LEQYIKLDLTVSPKIMVANGRNGCVLHEIWS